MINERSVGASAVGYIGLGAAALSLSADHDDGRSIEVIHAALDAGVRLIDTAYAYTTLDGLNHNESLIAQALQSHPSGASAFVVSKGGHWRTAENFPIDGRPEVLRSHVDLSLKALGQEAIDLYFLHWPDPQVPIEESAGALEELRSLGKIRAVGLSNVSQAQLEQAGRSARIDAVQNHLSIFDRDDAPLARWAHERGIAYLAYSPLSGSGRSGTGRLEVLREFGEARGASPQQVALAWLLQSSPALPLVGASRPASIRDSAQAATVSLTAAELLEITELVDKADAVKG